ncbi:MAG TPA: GNAT family N-acetyltransferase [Caulobacteraceae bacterium]|nr:GNAT family N-acetyltransferase [Caulobacteraceae bacterium]
MADIRELREDDVEAIPLIDGGPAWHGGPEKWRRYWDEHSAGLRFSMVGAIGNRLAAYGSIVWRSQYPPFAEAGIPEIQDMVVSQAWRRRGLATALIAAFEARARDAGYPTMGIGVGLYADYGSAQRLYARLGYRPDGRGITYDNVLAAPGSHVRVDDDLVLWLTKAL